MYLIKIITMLGIFFICLYIGNYKAKNYENRVIELNKFQNALVMLKSKIEFTHEPIKTIFEDISRIIYEDNNNIFEMTLNNTKDICGSWNNSINILKTNLNKEDKDVMRMFGKMLGKTDIKGQINEIELSMELIKRQINNAEKEKEKNFKLYKTMGAVIGLGICIILA